VSLSCSLSLSFLSSRNSFLPYGSAQHTASFFNPQYNLPVSALWRENPTLAADLAAAVASLAAGTDARSSLARDAEFVLGSLGTSSFLFFSFRFVSFRLSLSSLGCCKFCTLTLTCRLTVRTAFDGLVDLISKFHLYTWLHSSTIFSVLLVYIFPCLFLFSPLYRTHLPT
jgi:hypothetical protein